MSDESKEGEAKPDQTPAQSAPAPEPVQAAPAPEKPTIRPNMRLTESINAGEGLPSTKDKWEPPSVPSPKEPQPSRDEEPSKDED